MDAIIKNMLVPVIGLVLFLGGSYCLLIGAVAPSTAWLSYMLAAIILVAALSKKATGAWAGALIDSRNKISLSRTQMLFWTILISTGLLAAFLHNMYVMEHLYPKLLSTLAAMPDTFTEKALKEHGALLNSFHSSCSATAGMAKTSFAACIEALNPSYEFSVPGELYALMGIGTGSLVLSPAVKANKSGAEADVEQLAITKDNLARSSAATADTKAQGQLLVNTSMADAKLQDMVRGEEVGNAAQIDLGKLQMALLTAVAGTVYGIMLFTWLSHSSESILTALPALGETLIYILGISHSGYLVHKAIPHSKSSPSNAPSAPRLVIKGTNDVEERADTARKAADKAV